MMFEIIGVLVLVLLLGAVAGAAAMIPFICTCHNDTKEGGE